MRDPAPRHPVSRQHLDALTDSVGIAQHAIGSRPDPAHGYCTDDVARSLQVDLLHGRELGWPRVASSARRGLQFLVEAFDPGSGRFRNFRSAQGEWIGGEGSEDCQGRALHALGDVIADAPDAPMVETAASMFDRALETAANLTALRARASVLLGCAAVLDAGPSSRADAISRRIVVPFEAAFAAGRGATWPWPEPVLTYENALPARALIVTGRVLRSNSMVDTGLRILDWLLNVQVAPDGHLSPIGNGWWPRGGEKAGFDQQPIEATALLLAAEAAYEVTGDRRYLVAIERAYAWFLGQNDLGVAVADPARGACHDGLTPHGVNTNEGAESTLMWLTAAEHVRNLRSPWAMDASRAGAVAVASPA